MWRKPEAGWISFMVAAVVFANYEACSAIHRDASGHFIGASVVHFPHFQNPALL